MRQVPQHLTFKLVLMKMFELTNHQMKKQTVIV